ncbi:MAG: hypothetical protein AB7P69_15845 [Candidatus Binatia bacterium]
MSPKRRDLFRCDGTIDHVAALFERWLSFAHRQVTLPDRAVMMLAALESCRPGFVSDRVLLALLADFTASRQREDRRAALRATVWRLRREFLRLGLPDVIIRIVEPSGSGYRLLVPVMVPLNNAPSASLTTTDRDGGYNEGDVVPNRDKGINSNSCISLPTINSGNY